MDFFPTKLNELYSILIKIDGTFTQKNLKAGLEYNQQINLPMILAQ